MKVTYGREILVSTKQFENQRFKVEIELTDEDVRKFYGEQVSPDVVVNHARSFVDKQLFSDVVRAKTGVVRKQESTKKERETRMAKAAADQYGFDFDVVGDAWGGQYL